MNSVNYQTLLAAQERVNAGDYGPTGPQAILDEHWTQLIAQYPHIDFGYITQPPVGLGWWDLLNDAFKKINEEMKKLPKAPELRFKIAQIKEKFGTLRFYYDMRVGPGGKMPGTDVYTDAIQAIGAAVEDAESLSHRTCETCGEPGESRGGGWVKTLCDEHAVAMASRHG